MYRCGVKMDLVVKILVLIVILGYGRADSRHHSKHTKTSHQHKNSTEKSNDSPELRKNLVDCTEESKVDPNMVLKFRTGKWKRVKKEPIALKQWALCLLTKSNMMTREGILKQDVVLATIPDKDKAKVVKVIDKCLYKKPHSPHDIAWHYIRCFRSKYPKYSII